MIKEYKISILSPSYNQGNFIEENILSILNQQYKNFEHIIIDGGSTDNTVKILKKYPHLKWVSEQDEGQSDALNKGLAMATGDIIGWLNSDDYYEKNIFTDVNDHFQDLSVDWIVGNTANYYESLNHIEFTKSPTINYEILLKNPGYTRQPGTFHRKSLLDKVGGWDVNFNVVMDFELWIRLLKVSTPKMLDNNYAYFRIHPDQKTTGRNIFRYIKFIDWVLKKENKSFIERKKILRKQYISFLKYMIKIFLINLNLLDEKYSYLHISTKKRN